jgi:hypothetical protein
MRAFNAQFNREVGNGHGIGTWYLVLGIWLGFQDRII